MQRYWVWLSLLKGLSRREKQMLLEQYRDPETLYASGVMPDGTDLDRDLFEAEKVLNICARKGIRVIPMGDSAYPERLREISDPPILLYCRGILPDFGKQPVIGVVGTRKASAYGLQAAKELSAELCRGGALIISGGATGIDTCALEGGISEDRPVAAVLGCGVDITYPISNRKLFMDVMANGCLLSEYAPGTEAVGWHFPERNRIISGISNGVLVVEAPEKSGALITGKDALDQGRDVYVVPGNIDVESCRGSNRLMQKGAYPVLEAWDILQQYASQYPDTVSDLRAKQSKTEKKKVKSKPACKKDIDNPPNKPYIDLVETDVSLTEEERYVLSFLSARPEPLDAVIGRMAMPSATVLRILTNLSLQGIVITHPGKLISRNKQ